VISLAKSYLKTVNDQDQLINELSQKIQELEQELSQRPVPIKKEHDIVLYRLGDEDCLGEDKIFPCSPNEAERIVQEYVETSRITLKDDYGGRDTVLAPSLVAKGRIEKPIRLSQIRANGVTVEGE